MELSKKLNRNGVKIMVLMFQICLIAGLILIVLSFLLGEFFDFVGVDGLDLDGFDLSLILPLSPMLFILLVTVFGGAGLTLIRLHCPLPNFMIIIIALLIGYSITFLVNRFVLRPLKKAENTSAVPQEELVGKRAIVTEKIHKNRFGEIKYTINGNSYVAPAKATEEEEILVGEEVSICWIEDHIFYVTHIKLD